MVVASCPLQLYFLTPVFHGIHLPPEESAEAFAALSPEFLRVAAMLGITKKTFHHKDPVCLKFFGALALHDIIHEVPTAQVMDCVSDCVTSDIPSTCGCVCL